MPFPLLSYHSLPFLQIGNYQVKARVTRSQYLKAGVSNFGRYIMEVNISETISLV